MKSEEVKSKKETIDMKESEILERNIRLLSAVSEQEARMAPKSDSALPDVTAVGEVVSLARKVIFPGFFDKREANAEIRQYHIGVAMERLCDVLRRQIGRALVFQRCRHCEATDRDADRMTLAFIDQLPRIKELLYTDVEAIFNDDPAAHTYSEVIFSYPVVEAMLHYRIAHALWEMQIPVIPRIITEKAHSLTGIDIHPGAQIGEYFAIDHGTGVVIGETCVIGNHVQLYQGVTLGSGRKDNRLQGPRHPIIGDNVTIYSNSTLLGRITIGHDTIIGGNIWVTHDVPPHSRLLQGKAIRESFEGGLGI